MPIRDIAPTVALIHLHGSKLCIVHMWKEKMRFYLLLQLFENQSCLKALAWKIGHCYCIIPTSNTSHIQPLFFIKTLTQWAKHTDRIKIRYGQKCWKQKADIKENLLHVVFVLIDISLLKFSLLFKYFDTQLVCELWLDQKCHNKLQRGGEVVPLHSDWLKGFE